jgi:hypothetical protein
MTTIDPEGYQDRRSVPLRDPRFFKSSNASRASSEHSVSGTLWGSLKNCPSLPRDGTVRSALHYYRRSPSEVLL